MNKKFLLGVFIILIFVVCVFGYIQYSHNDDVKIGNVYFSIPQSFDKGAVTKDKDVNITNGTNSILISECSNDIENYIDEYENYTSSNNLDVSISTFDVSNINVYKVHVWNNSQTTHYWFKINGEPYTIYSWDDADNNLDYVVTELIRSAHIL